ncbi:universal stress protein [Burkholderia gladioli]|uniref:UspA n=1 Tax=Burkholderia gladioli (strain BSR3) TaxID=999541 RepID=F2L8K8_BURGS|nr:universal stress protein [Burkholderia gladioli]AEA60779.1 UspA [Burkholderia gladioli BSR3]MBW5286271.1 universal stress protein [Burkholderia gladioli]CAG9238307.1 UspA [Burkholderia gladioli]
MYSRILVAIDGSRTSSRALDVALQIAADNAATLETLYVIDFPVAALDAPGYDPSIFLDAARAEGQRLGADAAQRMAAHGVKGTQLVLETEPIGEDIAAAIERAARAWPAELLVMGTHGRRGWRHLMLGSVAERTLRIATCPVLLVPARMAAAEPKDEPAGAPADTAADTAKASS